LSLNDISFLDNYFAMTLLLTPTQPLWFPALGFIASVNTLF